jgi:hypothetical protein
MADAFTQAETALNALDWNRIASDAENRKYLKRDIAAILAALCESLPTACPYLRTGEPAGAGQFWMHCALAEQQGRVAEAARNFAVVTAGLENTPEGAALLAALKQVEKANE